MTLIEILIGVAGTIFAMFGWCAIGWLWKEAQAQSVKDSNEGHKVEQKKRISHDQQQTY